MRIPLLLFALFGFFIFLTASNNASAQSAPFCVVDANGTDCSYYDTPACERVASRRRGACVVAPQARRSSSSDVWGAFDRGLEVGSSMVDESTPQQTRMPPSHESESPHLANRGMANRVWERVCLGMRNSQYDTLGSADHSASTIDEITAQFDAVETRYNECLSAGGAR